MKIRNQILTCVAAVVLLVALCGCSHIQMSQMPNELSFSLDGISEIIISYDDENITFYEGEGDELVIKEYISENKSSYYAKVDRSSSGIKISEGSKPLFKDGFFRYIEVYLPASYHEALTVTTTDGDIDISGVEVLLSTFHIDTASGTVELNSVEAKNIYLSSTRGTLDLHYLKGDTIRIDTTSGEVACDKLCGNVSYTTTSGSADIKSAIGQGSYRANNSGKLNVVYTDVTGDLSFFNKNDCVSIVLPSELEFEFIAATKNGSVATSFQECVSVDGKTIRGTVGEHPAVTVSVETNNGDIDIKQ